MLAERELWACAQQVLRQHKDGVDDYIADRITALATAGDSAGIVTWKAIAHRVDQLRDQHGADKARH